MAHKTTREKVVSMSEDIVPIPVPHLAIIKTMIVMMKVQQQVLDNYIADQLGVDTVSEAWELDIDRGVLVRGKT